MTHTISGNVFTVEDRIAAQRIVEEGWGTSFVVEPLLAIFGGFLGGVATTALLWNYTWSRLRRRLA